MGKKKTTASSCATCSFVAFVAIVAAGNADCKRRESDVTKESPRDAAAVPEDVLPKRGPVPAPFAGTFHLLIGQPAVNLLLADDGTFVWRYEDCVCFGGGWGTWDGDGSSIVLHPPKEGLEWATLVQLDGGRTTVDRKPAPALVVRVTLRPSGYELAADVEWALGGSQNQRWQRGRVCPVCKPMMPGPIPTGADAAPCDQPLSTQHRGPGLACH